MSALTNMQLTVGRTIDLAVTPFGAFLMDRNISDTIKELILSLQNPIIKVTLGDSNYSSNNNHAAINVLNSITRKGKSL